MIDETTYENSKQGKIGKNVSSFIVGSDHPFPSSTLVVVLHQIFVSPSDRDWDDGGFEPRHIFPTNKPQDRVRIPAR